MAEEKKAKVKAPTPAKRHIQDEKKRMTSKMFRSRVATAIKTFAKEKNAEALSAVYSLLDKGVKKGIYHANMVGRKKARLTHQLGK